VGSFFFYISFGFVHVPRTTMHLLRSLDIQSSLLNGLNAADVQLRETIRRSRQIIPLDTTAYILPARQCCDALSRASSNKNRGSVIPTLNNSNVLAREKSKTIDTETDPTYVILRDGPTLSSARAALLRVSDD
jgi:hypothetical protein